MSLARNAVQGRENGLNFDKSLQPAYGLHPISTYFQLGIRIYRSAHTHTHKIVETLVQTGKGKGRKITTIYTDDASKLAHSRLALGTPVAEDGQDGA